MWTCGYPDKHSVYIDYENKKIVISDSNRNGEPQKEFHIRKFNDAISNCINSACPICQDWGENVWICGNGHITTFDTTKNYYIHSFDYPNKVSYTWGMEALSKNDFPLKVEKVTEILNTGICPLCIDNLHGFSGILMTLEINYK